MLKIYNTLTEQKEEFIPVNPGKAGVYACGMTVYDKPHIGHVRKEVAFDIIINYLRYLKFEVTYVRNITDIDDKIIMRANERNIGFRELTEEVIESFNRAMNAMGLATPDIEPKATLHMPEIISMIEKLIEKGHAYEANGSVYFAVQSFKGYGKLSRRNIDDMISGTRFDPDPEKKNPLDFALWKKSKEGEPLWESPWGEGRPGWHIECSAMSTRYLGDTFDIHGGGRDLIFPHHENEIAQAEAATGKPFARYWMHNGFLNVEGEKMSKSLGNFITVDDALESYHPEVLRYFMLSTHYRSPINFSMKNLSESEKQLTYFYTTIKGLKDIAGAASPSTSERSDSFVSEFREAMDDDFNTAKVVAALFTMFKFLNEKMAKKKTEPSPEEASGYLSALRETGLVLGIMLRNPKTILEEIREIQLKRNNVSRDTIEALISERNNFRKEKNFLMADAKRDALLAIGVVIKDTPNGTDWSFS